MANFTSINPFSRATAREIFLHKLPYFTISGTTALLRVYVNEDFRSDLGFIPRTDIFKSGNSVTRHFYPSSNVINRHSVGLLSIIYWRPNLDLKKTDHQFNVSWDAELKDQSIMELSYFNNFIFLTHDFDPTRSGTGEPLSGNSGYYFNQVTASFQSNQAQRLIYNIETTLGEFFNGNSYFYEGGLSVRMQPWVNLGIAVKYDRITLPNLHPDADYWLLSPKMDVTFTKSVFWSTLVQYSNQRENLGINSRLQWRFAPLSDLFLVYNHNYQTDNFGRRFRSLNLKASYWFNVSSTK